MPEVEVVSDDVAVLSRSVRGAHVSESVRLAYIRKYESSGLKQRDYADREGLVYTTFLGWLRKYRRKEREVGGEVRFTEVRLRDVDRSQCSKIGSPSLEVRLPDGVVLCGSAASDLARLYQLIVGAR